MIATNDKLTEPERIRCSALVLELEQTVDRRLREVLDSQKQPSQRAARVRELLFSLRTIRAMSRKLQNEPSSATAGKERQNG